MKGDTVTAYPVSTLRLPSPPGVMDSPQSSRSITVSCTSSATSCSCGVQPALIFDSGSRPREVFMSTTVQGPKGLEGITAANSGICYIDGDQGVLAYRGIDIHELADHSTFEEVCYLLWFGRLPNRSRVATS